MGRFIAATLLVLSCLLVAVRAELDAPRNGIESVLDRPSSLPWHVQVGRVFGKWGLRDGQVCEEHYGMMPCSVTLGGNAVLLVAYGFMLLKAAQLLSDGSELLLSVMSPGVIGGLVLPILGAFPDALLIAGTFLDRYPRIFFNPSIQKLSTKNQKTFYR